MPSLKRYSLCFTLLLLLCPEVALAWGNLRTHERLTDAALARFDSPNASTPRAFDQFLKQELELKDGVDTELGLQRGIDPKIDADFGDPADPHTRRFETFLERKPDFFPPSPDPIVLNPRCENDDPSCFDSLQRYQLKILFDAGVFAEDNPTVRSAHHFHDPIFEHAPPTGNHGLDDRKRLIALGLPVGVSLTVSDIAAAAVRGGDPSRIAGGILEALINFGFPFVNLRLGSFNLTGLSALNRALELPFQPGGERPSATYPQNLYSLAHAERYLYQALTRTTKGEREHYLALHFLALASVLHLLEDMTSVAHVRNDFLVDHLLPIVNPSMGSTLEDFAEKPDAAGVAANELISSLGTPGSGVASEPYDILAALGTNAPDLSQYISTLIPLDPSGFDAADFWQSGLPGSGVARNTGLADIVNANFFSRATIANSLILGDSYLKPVVPSSSACSQGATTGQSTWIANLPERQKDTGELVPSSPAAWQPYLSSRLVPHLARCIFHHGAVEHATKQGVSPPPEPPTFSVIDSSVQWDYIDLLFSFTVDYVSRFLQFYFAPRIDVIPTGNNHFEIRNLSTLPFQFEAGAVEIVYEDVNGNGERQKGAALCGDPNVVVTLAPVDQPGSTSSIGCTLTPPSGPAPARADDFWVVVRGALGQRGQAASPTEFDASTSPADFVVGYRHVRPQIAYHHKDPVTGRDDIYVVTVDLSHSIDPNPNNEPSPRAVNRTAALRPLLASQGHVNASQVSFGAPSAEPGGSRLALGADLAVLDPEVPNEAWILDLGRAVSDPNAFVPIIPPNGITFATGVTRPVVWKRGPTPDSVWFCTAQSGSFSGFASYDVQTKQTTPVASTSAICPNSVYGSSVAGVLTNLGSFNVALLNAGSGSLTDLFGQGQVNACPSPGGCNIPFSSDVWPDFSPDGTHVVFVRSTPDLVLLGLGPLFVADLSSSTRPITALPGGGGLATHPEWSPDGQWIVYLGPTGDLFAIPSAGGQALQLTNDGANRSYPTWLSPLRLPQ